MRLAPLTALLPLALGACSLGQNVKLADGSIAQFHQALNAGQFQPIYRHSAPDLKAVTSEDKMVALLGAVHRKLGAFKSGTSQGWNENLTPAGHFVTISYAATYEKGQASEQFVYRIGNNQAKLVSYNINSDALILN